MFVTGLSRELEELMVEGLLLQVSVPEVQSLYHILLDRANSQHTNRCMSPTQENTADCDEHTQFNSQGTNLPLNQVRPLPVDKKRWIPQNSVSNSAVLFLFSQDGSNSMVGTEKKAKRHLERENAEQRKDKKHSHKRQKMNKKNPKHRSASTSSSPRSDFSQSDDSDQEMAVCPAERCQLPEGDEVRKMPSDIHLIWIHNTNMKQNLHFCLNVNNGCERPYWRRELLANSFTIIVAK